MVKSAARTKARRNSIVACFFFLACCNSRGAVPASLAHNYVL